MMASDGGAPKFYDRTFTFHWLLTMLLGVLFAGVMLAYVAPLLGEGSVKPGGRAGLVVGALTLAVIDLAIFGLFWRMRVVVDSGELLIVWGYLGWLRIRLRLQDVEGYREVTFRPIRDFGGWGWRMGRDGSRCYNTSGNQGVELRIGGRPYIVGVTDPPELSHALEQATGMKPGEPGPFSAGAK